MRYNAVLAERNRLLKMQLDETMLAIYDRQLVDHGTIIHERRRTFVERLQPLVESFYRTLSGDREQVALHYKSELNDRPFDEILQAARQKDLVNEFTTAGIHRDDLVLRIADYPLRKYGSQGQQKSFLIALKLAQYRIIADEKAEKTAVAARRLVRQTRRLAGRTAHPVSDGRRFRTNPHHRLQSDPPASHSRQGMRPLCAFQRTGRSHYVEHAAVPEEIDAVEKADTPENIESSEEADVPETDRTATGNVTAENGEKTDRPTAPEP